jgi:hypothetical protein
MSHQTVEQEAQALLKEFTMNPFERKLAQSIRDLLVLLASKDQQQARDWPMCRQCEKRPASCFGAYEGSGHDVSLACDDCCGHGNEDGWCKPLVEAAAMVGPLMERAENAEQAKDAADAALAQVREIAEQAVRLAKQSTNGHACYARTKLEHRLIAEQHEAIAKLGFAALLGQVRQEQDHTNTRVEGQPTGEHGDPRVSDRESVPPSVQREG